MKLGHLAENSRARSISGYQIFNNGFKQNARFQKISLSIIISTMMMICGPFPLFSQQYLGSLDRYADSSGTMHTTFILLVRDSLDHYEAIDSINFLGVETGIQFIISDTVVYVMYRSHYLNDSARIAMFYIVYNKLQYIAGGNLSIDSIGCNDNCSFIYNGQKIYLYCYKPYYLFDLARVEALNLSHDKKMEDRLIPSGNELRRDK